MRRARRQYVATPDSSASPNVQRVYAQTAAWNLAQALWQNQLLSLYLYAVFDSDMRSVGLAEGAQGIARLVSAVVIGHAVDQLPRRPLLAAASTSGVAIHAVIGWLIAHPPSLSPRGRLRLWLAMLGVFAIWSSLQQTLVDVLFADSVPTGGRVRTYMRRGAVVKSAQLAGPLVQLTVFFATGATAWTEETVRPAMLCGVAVGALASALLIFLNPRATLGDAADAFHMQRTDLRKQATDADPTRSSGARHGGTIELSVASEEGTENRNRGAGSANADGSNAGGEVLDGTATALSARGAARLRWTVLVFDVLRVCAGGLIVKYWGLYFVHRFGLTPVEISILMGSIFALGFVTVLAVGRVVAAYRLRRGLVCLGLLAIVDAANFGSALAPYVSVAAGSWAVREACLAGMLELKKSLMMDHTPKGSRGVWNAVQGLQQGLWSGTATVGGYVVAAKGFEADFLLMSTLFLLSAAVWATIVTAH